MTLTNIQIKVTAIALAALITGCSKSFLEVAPKGRLITSTTSDYNLSLNNLGFLNLATDAQAALGDEIAAVSPYFDAATPRTQRLFRYESTIYQPNEDAPETLIPMQNIYSYNKIINEVLGSTEGSENEKKSIRAEALVGRAWTYFLLINYYGKPYTEATASTDPGYPIVTNAEVTLNNFSRASVKEVYDFIVSDLTTALPDLPTQITHRLRPSRAAGEGLLAKVYVHMGKFSEALPLLNAAIAGIANAVIPTGLYNYNTAFATGGTFLPISPFFGPTYPTVPNNRENIYAKQFSNSWSFSNSEILVNAATVALFGPSDLRRNFYTSTYYPGTVSVPTGMLRRFSPGSSQIGVLVPELYLLRAECKVRLDDLTGAKADLETLRVNRMPVADASIPSAIAGQKIPLLRFVFEERTREFAVQGFRWFDMRRLSVDPLIPVTTFSHSLYDGSGNLLNTYSVSPERLTLKISPKLIAQNPQMANNP